ncbi:MAG: response regulator transcription factor [candidate division Zixibacteria bacterium]|nr:response regulator transcription factor [candidate division Zixibacteria bacterium]
MGKIEILVVDDHDLLRRGLIELLNKNNSFSIVGEACNGRKAIEIAEKVQPDIILLDISMPELNGIEAIGRLKQVCPSCKIIIITMHNLNKHISSALKQNISGYLLKSIGADELFTAIDKVYRGGFYFCEEINQKIISEYTSFIGGISSQSSIDALSPREKEVLQLVVEGFTGKEIAKKMNISPKTVEHHRYHLMSKLKCSNIAGLIRMAIEEGIVNLA